MRWSAAEGAREPLRHHPIADSLAALRRWNGSATTRLDCSAFSER